MLLLLLATACQTPPDPSLGDSGQAELVCPDALSWETAAAPLLLSECASCHGSQRVGEDRYGAPEDVDLDSRDAAVLHADRILARLEAGDMPPSTGVPDYRIERFATWLACGAPGEALDWPEGQAPVTPTMAEEVAVQVSESAVDPALLDVVRSEDLTGEALLTERWLIDGDDLWLVERERYDPDGSTIFLDQWDPPLAVLLEGQPAGETDSWRLHSEEGSTSEVQEAWLASDAEDAFFDPQLQRDPTAVQVLLSSDSGVLVGLRLSPQFGPTQGWYDEPDLDPLGQLLTFVQNTTFSETPPTGDILFAERSWIERVYAMEEP